MAGNISGRDTVRCLLSAYVREMEEGEWSLSATDDCSVKNKHQSSLFPV